MVFNLQLKISKTFQVIGLLALFVGLGLVTAVSPTLAFLILATIFSLPVLAIAFYRPSWVVLFLTAYMPFETLVLKLLPVPDRVYLLTQLAGEGLIYATCMLVLLKRVAQQKSFAKTPIDVPLLIFFIVAFLSIFINQSPLVGSLLQLRTLLRYIFLFYLVVNINLTSQQVNRLLKIILFIGFIQIVIGGLQLIIGTPLNQLLLPRLADAELAGQTRPFILVSRGREFGSIYGTLGDTVYYGLFMLFVLSIYLARIQKLKFINVVAVGTMFLAVSYSFSRAAVFGFLFVLIIYFHSKVGFKRSILVSFIIMPILIVGMLLILGTANSRTFVSPELQAQGIFDNISGIFTRRYIEIAQKQRLGHLLGTAPTILANNPVLGFGPDEQATIERINSSDPSYLLTPLTGRTANTFEDVFWVALLGYYGVIGTALWAYIIFRFYRLALLNYKQSTEKITKQLSLIVILITLLAPVLLFFNQTLEFRIYSYYFWLFPALLISLAKKPQLIR